MSIAPQSISSNLRRMSDVQLAQYAKMHANDPYIFPLAFQESQDRKNMRSEAMARQSGQTPPPVVQQDLAQMMPQQAPQMPQQAQLPEEQGIGALPAQNMQGMAGGGITGEQHYADKGLVQPAYGYTAMTAADLPKNITPEDISTYTQKMQSSAEQMAAPEQAKTAALFDPYIEKLKNKQADIDERKNTNTHMALLQAGLAMMGGTSPYGLANIAKGGQEGVAAYLSGKKSIQDSQDLLDHSQFLAEQAKNAALKGDVKDQITLQNAAQANLMAGKNLEYHGIQILNSSKADEGKLRAEKEGNDIKRFQASIDQQKANSLAGLQSAEEDYYKSRVVSPEDKLAAQLDARVNQATSRSKQTLAAMLAKPYVDPKAVNRVIDLHNQEIDSIYAAHPSIKDKYGYIPQYVAPQDTTSDDNGFFSWFTSKAKQPAEDTTTPGLPGLAAQPLSPAPGGPPTSNPNSPLNNPNAPINARPNIVPFGQLPK